MRKVIFVLLSLGLIVGLVLSGFNPLSLKTKAGLQVTTEGTTASLFLNDQYLDKSPFIDKKIQPGNYSLRISPDDRNLASYELPITLNKGIVTVVTWNAGPTLETSGGVVYEMEKLRNSHDIKVIFQTVPDGAIITVDNGTKQFSPLTLTNLTEGNHDFEVSLPSYETQQHNVKLIPGHQITITVFLGKLTEQSATEPTNNQASETPTEEEKDSATTITGPSVQILNTGYFVNNQEVLRVRANPNQGGAELGFAPVGNFYPYLDEDLGWYEIQFNGQPGWVSTQFSQKVASGSAQTNL